MYGRGCRHRHMQSAGEVIAHHLPHILFIPPTPPLPPFHPPPALLLPSLPPFLLSPSRICTHTNIFHLETSIFYENFIRDLSLLMSLLLCLSLLLSYESLTI